MLGSLNCGGGILGGFSGSGGFLRNTFGFGLRRFGSFGDGSRCRLLSRFGLGGSLRRSLKGGFLRRRNRFNARRFLGLFVRIIGVAADHDSGGDYNISDLFHRIFLFESGLSRSKPAHCLLGVVMPIPQ